MNHYSNIQNPSGRLNPEQIAELKRSVHLQILEQPASKTLRFRYECEGRSAGSIPGANSTNDSKTFPSVKIIGYSGKAVVVVSCVTKDPPFKPHPHRLVGKDGCKDGICSVPVHNESMSYTFSNLGIQCAKKKDIDESLCMREKQRIDPFKTGFAHRLDPNTINLNMVRLCFQTFLKVPDNQSIPIPPVVSDPIFDKKSMTELTIYELSDEISPANGGKKIMLFCDKVVKEDISIKIFQRENDEIVWETFAEFQPKNVHRQVGISFRTPKYKSVDIECPVNVYLQLYRPSDGKTSEALPFEYIPIETNIQMKRKRKKIENGNISNLFRHPETQNDTIPRSNPGNPKATTSFNIRLEPGDGQAINPPDGTILPSTCFQPIQIPVHDPHTTYNPMPTNYIHCQQTCHPIYPNGPENLNPSPYSQSYHPQMPTGSFISNWNMNSQNTAYNLPIDYPNGQYYPTYLQSPINHIGPTQPQQNHQNMTTLIDMDINQLNVLRSNELNILHGQNHEDGAHLKQNCDGNLKEDIENMTDSFSKYL